MPTATSWRSRSGTCRVWPKLLPLIDADAERAVARVTEALRELASAYERALRAGQRARLGLRTDQGARDARLIDDWLALLARTEADFTRSHRALVAAAVGDDGPLREAVGSEEELTAWLARWRARCAQEDRAAEDAAARVAALRQGNPRIVARNHRVEEALAAASDDGKLDPFERMLDALRRPFDDDRALEDFAHPAPVEFTRRYMTFCGT